MLCCEWPVLYKPLKSIVLEEVPLLNSCMYLFWVSILCETYPYLLIKMSLKMSKRKTYDIRKSISTLRNAIHEH